MPNIDLKAAQAVFGQGGTPMDVVETAFGIPSCMASLPGDVMGLIPSDILAGIGDDIFDSKSNSEGVLADASNFLRSVNGGLSVVNENGGLTVISDASKSKIDRNEGLLGKQTGGFMDAISEAVNQGQQLYQNVNSIISEVESQADCVKSFNDFLRMKDSAGLKSELSNMDPAAYDSYIDAEYGSLARSARAARAHIDACNNTLRLIDETLRSREEDPSLEPVFNPQLSSILQGLGFKFPDQVDEEDPTPEEIIRLNFGPPKSSYGQFIFSQDGLYYDSQTSGLVPVLMELDARKARLRKEDLWTFEHDPNLGGRGKGLSNKDLDSYFNTILDPEIIDDSVFLSNYYKKDGFLQDLIGQRNKRINDIERQVRELINKDASQPIIFNLKQSLISENNFHRIRINKRKKQIELAVKLPSIYGSDIRYSVGEVPINDFSYLQGTNISLDIEKQRSMVLNQEDISGVVLPLTAPTFVVPPVSTKHTATSHLLLPDLGEGSFIFDGTSSVYTPSATRLDATDMIVTDSLFAVYNYLHTNIELPDSTYFQTRNSESDTDENNSQLVASSVDDVFTDGLAIPYLRGVTKHYSSSDMRNPQTVGSYVKLPDTNQFNDWMYNRLGATFETWVHLPYFDSVDMGYNDGPTQASGLYRLILANENTGLAAGSLKQDDILNLRRSDGSDTVRGMVFGFTRDRRITSYEQPSNSNLDNKIDSQCLFIAPTQSYDSSSVGFLSRNYYDNEVCQSKNEWHSMKLDASTVVNGKAVSSVGLEYCHIAFTLNPKLDEVKFYLDGTLMCTSSLSFVFGVDPGDMPNVPSTKQANSFEYSTTTVGPEADSIIKSCPKLYDYTTPWILGGGYTDGMAEGGNFMGGKYGGVISGLKGHLGATKFYSKSLTSDEVLNNYNLNKDFFKNIDVPNTMWEPIISITFTS